tara:strand:+ start:34 stop:1506 length:1473 start_codon:yes stop_codon:yes gene_type:complete
MPLYSRKDMPQVNTQNLGKALGMTKRKAKVTKGMSLAVNLKQSQKELIKSKVKGVAAKYSKPTDMKPLIISKDNYIIDGHHRWAAAIYKFGKDVEIPTHTIHLKKDEAIELYNSVAKSLGEAMSIAARKKMARKSKSKLKRGLKKRIRKMKKKRSNDDLQKAAIRKAKTILMQKMLKKAPADMTMMDKMKFSKMLAKKPGKIQKVARKILPKLKQAESDRVKKMKARNTQKKFESIREDITIPIKVGDTVLGGKFKNKRIVVKSIGKNEKGDITINNKPLLKFRLLPQNEGWSNKYKKSINCNNPKGFSQKAHCAGKKKRENVAPNHDGKSAPYGSGYKKKNEIYFDMFGNKCKNATTLDGRCIDKYHPSPTIREPLSEIPMGDLKQIDTFADKKLNPVDVVLTDKHFFDRLNDPRNDKEISKAELIGFFKRLSKKKKEFLSFLDKYNQVVASDDRTNINIPFMKQANKVIAKTVMRKKDFKTQNQKVEI